MLEWKETSIPGYLVSNTGQVASLKKGLKLLRIQQDANGYCTIQIGNVHKFVHVLVATAFIPNPSNLSVVNHKDWNPSNNHVSNLEWMTYSENSLYRNPKTSIPRVLQLDDSSDQEWRLVEGYPSYLVSNKGNVKRADSNILKIPQVNNDYLCTKLRNENGRTQHSIHCLVAAAFLGPIAEGMVVNHINGNKQDNRAENLEIVSQAANVHHAINVIGTRKTTSVQQFTTSGVLVRVYKSVKDAAHATGVKSPGIHAVLNGSQKTCGGFVWKAPSRHTARNDAIDVGDLCQKPIVQLQDGIVVGRYVTVNDAARRSGLSRQNITKVIKGERSHCGGFQWKDETFVRDVNN